MHVAIIMDGNGRWATARGWSRSAGHRAGVETVRKIVEAAPDLGVGILTLYCFSSDNWKRPPQEVATLMRLLARFLVEEVERCIENDVRVSIIGRRDRLSPALVRGIAAAETRTRGGTRLHLRLAIDYSGRDAILRAVERAEGAELSKEEFQGLLGLAYSQAEPAPDVDLLIRTGGEQRLSDFLLWEAAYAELLFSKCMWPDFGPDELAAALEDFRGRERRFGRAPAVRQPVPVRIEQNQ